jgi:hypothetical protein
MMVSKMQMRIGDRATRRADVMAFYGDATSVRRLAFAATIKDMKGLLHNG